MKASDVTETTRHRVAVGDLLASWAARRPDRVCVAMNDREYTYAELDRVADRLHAGMAAHGVRPGDRVATLAPNRIELLELFAGSLVPAPFRCRSTPISRARSFVTSSASPGLGSSSWTEREGLRVEPLLAELPELETIVHLDEPDEELTAGSFRVRSGTPT